MPYENVLQVKSRADFRAWLAEHHAAEKEYYVVCKRGKPTDADILYYIDAVEEALCFGWIDSTIREVDGVSIPSSRLHLTIQTLGVAFWLVGNYLPADFHRRALICPSYAKGNAKIGVVFSQIDTLWRLCCSITSERC